MITVALNKFICISLMFINLNPAAFERSNETHVGYKFSAFLNGPLKVEVTLFLLRLKVAFSWYWSSVLGEIYLLTSFTMAELKNGLLEDLYSSLVILHQKRSLYLTSSSVKIALLFVPCVIVIICHCTVGAGLKVLNSHCIIHRDLKPEVFINSSQSIHADSEYHLLCFTHKT